MTFLKKSQKSDLKKMKEPLEEESISEEEPDDSSKSMSEGESEDVSDTESIHDSGNAGWADAMNKILVKKVKGHKVAILAKGKTDKQIEVKKRQRESQSDAFEIVGQSGEVVKRDQPEVQEKKARINPQEKRQQRKEWMHLGRRKPGSTDYPKERALMRIATKGVVYLFNGVKEQQKLVKSRLEKAGGSERQREKVLKSVRGSSFLNMLKGKAKSIPLTSEVKTRKSNEEEPVWSALRDDFMASGSLKDWDQQDSDDGGESSHRESDSED